MRVITLKDIPDPNDKARFDPYFSSFLTDFLKESENQVELTAATDEYYQMNMLYWPIRSFLIKESTVVPGVHVVFTSKNGHYILERIE